MRYAIVFTRVDTLPREGDFSYMCTDRHQMHKFTNFMVATTHRVFNTSAEAGKHRTASGDLVVEVPSLNVCQEQDWLWDWERTNVNCYAQRMQRKDKLARGF